MDFKKGSEIIIKNLKNQYYAHELVIFQVINNYDLILMPHKIILKITNNII
jgi:hypothetical protein